MNHPGPAMVLLGLLAYGCSDGGSSSGSDTAPTTSATLVHKFFYEPATSTYDVYGERFTQAEVDRDLAGTLCSRCHPVSVDQLKDSVHYKVAAPTDRVIFPGGGAHGMLDRACGLPATTSLTNFNSDINLGECSKCHVGRYQPIMEPFFASMFDQMGVPHAQEQAQGLVDAGLDCLICHSEHYRSYPADGILAALAPTATADAASPSPVGFARMARDNADFDRDGQPDLVIDMDGDGIADAPLMMDTDGDGAPDTPWPTVAQDRSLDAIASIGPTTEEACLRCHEHARTGYKRGTLFVEGHDVHSTVNTNEFEGAENQCTVCHTPSSHKFVRGHAVGGDLAAADYPPPPAGEPYDPGDMTDLACVHCHAPSSLPPGIHTERHLESMACETCHIPWGSGITYSLFGHGGQVSFSRAGDGTDTRLVAADMYATEGELDREADWQAYKVPPTLLWFDGGSSFLAQPLTVRGMPNAKITPFKPMSNGMVFDARYFSGALATNEAGAFYNAHSMYRFYAQGHNAEAFFGLGMLDMLPAAVRRVTMLDFMSPDVEIQTMALMQVFPNLVYFDKASFGYEHYLTRSDSQYDANRDGVIDAGSNYSFDMLQAANAGLSKFQGFNGPMGFPPDYEWYPGFDQASDLVSMKLPDGSLIKMFLQMQAANLPPADRDAFLAAAANYPSFSYITLGGHGVKPKEQALGATGCLECHGQDGVLARPVPVGRKVPTAVPGMGTLELPIYRWTYYNLHALTDLGLGVTSEQLLAGTANVDVGDNPVFRRMSDTTFVLNWFQPDARAGYRDAAHPTALDGTLLVPENLTLNGGSWMPVLEPVTDFVPNYAVLGYEAAELLW